MIVSIPSLGKLVESPHERYDGGFREAPYGVGSMGHDSDDVVPPVEV